MRGFIEELEVKKIHPSERALRSNLGSLDKLMSSLLEKGLLQPIIVRPNGDGFEAVAGNRRLEACRRLKMRKIACHVIELDEREAFEVSLVENIQHKTLDPIEEATAFRRYVADYGWGGVSELAKRLGKSVQYVSAKMKLLDLPQDIQDQISRRREIPPSVAQELLSLDEDQIRSLTEIIVKKQVTRSEVRKIVKLVKDNHESKETLYYFSRYQQQERRQRMTERALAKYIASLKVCMMRLDDALDFVSEDEWVVKEILMQHRSLIHQQVDNLLKLRQRLRRTLAR